MARIDFDNDEWHRERGVFRGHRGIQRERERERVGVTDRKREKEGERERIHTRGRTLRSANDISARTATETGKPGGEKQIYGSRE